MSVSTEASDFVQCTGYNHNRRCLYTAKYDPTKNGRPTRCGNHSINGRLNAADRRGGMRAKAARTRERKMENARIQADLNELLSTRLESAVEEMGGLSIMTFESEEIDQMREWLALLRAEEEPSG